MSTMYRVCRVDDYFRGAYCSGGAYNIPGFDNDFRHPEPSQDSKLIANCKQQSVYHYDDRMFYCFDSVAQLRNWFHNDDWLRWFYEHDFCVLQVAIDECDVVFGSSQCILELGKANYTREMTLNEIINQG